VPVVDHVAALRLTIFGEEPPSSWCSVPSPACRAGPMPPDPAVTVSVSPGENCVFSGQRPAPWWRLPRFGARRRWCRWSRPVDRRTVVSGRRTQPLRRRLAAVRQVVMTLTVIGAAALRGRLTRCSLWRHRAGTRLSPTAWRAWSSRRSRSGWALNATNGASPHRDAAPLASNSGASRPRCLRRRCRVRSGRWRTADRAGLHRGGGAVVSAFRAAWRRAAHCRRLIRRSRRGAERGD
jgi:hypothetical protein